MGMKYFLNIKVVVIGFIITVFFLFTADYSFARRTRDAFDVSVAENNPGFIAILGTSFREWQIKQLYKIDFSLLLEKYGEVNKVLLIDVILNFAKNFKESTSFNPHNVLRDIIEIINPLAADCDEFISILTGLPVAKEYLNCYYSPHTHGASYYTTYRKDLSRLKLLSQSADNVEDFLKSFEAFRHISTLNLRKAIDSYGGLDVLKRIIQREELWHRDTVLNALIKIAQEKFHQLEALFSAIDYWRDNGVDIFQSSLDKPYLDSADINDMAAVVHNIFELTASNRDVFYLINDILINLNSRGINWWNTKHRTDGVLTLEQTKPTLNIFGQDSSLARAISCSQKYPELFRLLIKKGVNLGRFDEWDEGYNVSEPMGIKVL